MRAAARRDRRSRDAQRRSAARRQEVDRADLGVSWRTPWRGEISVGAQNFWSAPLDAPRDADPNQARTPYIQYRQICNTAPRCPSSADGRFSCLNPMPPGAARELFFRSRFVVAGWTSGVAGRVRALLPDLVQVFDIYC